MINCYLCHHPIGSERCFKLIQGEFPGEKMFENNARHVPEYAHEICMKEAEKNHATNPTRGF